MQLRIIGFEHSTNGTLKKSTFILYENEKLNNSYFDRNHLILELFKLATIRFFDLIFIYFQFSVTQYNFKKSTFYE